MYTLDTCRGCPYEHFPKMKAPSPVQASLALVGEAPGTTELSKGLPFVGESGALLKRALLKAGLPTDTRVFATNVLLCRPPAGKPIKREAIERCRGRLIGELKTANPKLILCLGGTALQAISNDPQLKITKEQGRLVKSPLLPNTQVVAALHPAKVLRTPGDYQTFYAAVQYACKLLSGGPANDPGKTEWLVVDSQDSAIAAREILSDSRHRLLACDIETSGLNPRRDDILVVGIAYAKNKVLIYTPEYLNELRYWFDHPEKLWIWQNGKFDVSFLRRRGLPANVDHDILLMHYALNETTGTHDLEQMASIFLGAEPYKAEANQYRAAGQKKTESKKGFAHLPKSILYRRVALDADHTRQLFEVFEPQVENDSDLRRLYHDTLLPASAFLREVEKAGIYVNRELLTQLKREYELDMAEYEMRAIEAAAPHWDPDRYMEESGAKTASIDFKPTSPKQMSWLLFDRLMLRSSKQRGRSTDQEVLESLKGSHPVVNAVLDLRTVKKEYSTYIVGIEKRLDSKSRVHSTYLLHGTGTGRLSSRQPNLQNIPKRRVAVRNMFQAPPGRAFIEADYKTAELRVLAHLSQDPLLTEVFMGNRDLHDEMTLKLFGVINHDNRMKAKTVNFGIPYGRTAFSIALDFNMSELEAQQMIDDWFRAAPGAQRYLAACAESVLRGEALVTPLGRKRRPGVVTPMNLHELQNEARNFRMQSIASDMTLHSGIRLNRKLKPLNSFVINLVHDSILFEVPDDKVIILQVAAIIRETMEAAPRVLLGATIPFRVDIMTGKVWGELKEAI